MTDQILGTPKRRGRPPKAESSKNSENPVEHRNENRVARTAERVPMHATAASHIPKGVVDTDKYHYRWCADYGKGKIERYQKAGYEFVQDNEGNRIKRPDGEPLYLMRILKEFNEQDQAAKRERQITIQKQQMDKERRLKDGSVPEYLPKDQNML